MIQPLRRQRESNQPERKDSRIAQVREQRERTPGISYIENGTSKTSRRLRKEYLNIHGKV